MRNERDSRTVKRSLGLLLGLTAALLAPAMAQARMSLEPDMRQVEVLPARALSLPGRAAVNLAGDAPTWGWDAPRCAPVLLRAAQLSLPGEVVEDVLLSPGR
jgi:hypothetical protein